MIRVASWVPYWITWTLNCSHKLIGNTLQFLVCTHLCGLQLAVLKQVYNILQA